MKSKTFTHEFTDTGVVVSLRKVNPFLMQEARSSLLAIKPEPPKREVTEEGPLKGTFEVMDTDPEYIKILKVWEEGIDNAIMEMQIKRGVVSVDVDGWEDEVVELRKEFDILGIADRLPKDDLVCYITYIACGTPQDLQEFVQSIAVRSQPTKEAVDASKESFRANTPKQGRVVSQN